MSNEEDETILGTAGRFPFAMVICAIFLKGSVFLLLDGPLLVLMLRGESYDGPRALISEGVTGVWKEAALAGTNAFSVAVLLLLSLTVGLFLAPFEGIVSTGVPVLVSLAVLLLQKRGNRAMFFTPREFMRPDYVPLLAYLIKRPAEKLHWEWELFHYQVYWSIFASTAAFGGMSFALLRPAFTFPNISLCGGIILAFLSFALWRSYVMGQVHDYYRKRARP